MVVAQGDVYWASLYRAILSRRVGRVSKTKLRLILDGIDIVLGRGLQS